MTAPDDSLPASTAALDKLAAALDPRKLITALVTVPGQPVCLTVTSRHTSQLTEDIYASQGWFWWSWAERIAPVDDLDTTAARITAVLRATPATSPTGAPPAGPGAA